MDPDTIDPAVSRSLAERFFSAVPHGEVLGMEVVDVVGGAVTARLPYCAEIVGNPLTGVVHGGVITTLVDQTSGAAVFAAIGRPEAVATLDLRIDYLRPATPGEPIFARARCYQLNRRIAFVRCTVCHGDVERPIATSMSTFMHTPGVAPGLTEGAQ